MEGIHIASPNLPPGFRFHPTDQELIIHYLKKKVSSSPNPIVSIIADINLYKFNPWELPAKAFFGESEWFFFSPRDRKYPNGARPNRAAASGYWKATGTDKPIIASTGSQCLGVKKALVFYKGRPPKGMKTDWVMHEYRLLDDAPRSEKFKGSMRLDDWVLCRVRRKSNIPIQIGENHEITFSSSPPFNIQCLEQQLTHPDTKNNQFLSYAMGSQEGGAVDGCGNINFSFQETSKASIHDMDNQSQTPLFSSFQQRFESIKRTFSIGGLDEVVAVPPRKRLNASTSENMENTSMGDESSSSLSGWVRFPDAFQGL